MSEITRRARRRGSQKARKSQSIYNMDCVMYKAPEIGSVPEREITYARVKFRPQYSFR